MKTAGIVCEYNPFHSGHQYQIEQTRKNGATHVVCVMSGNFVQRGEAACLPKAQRASMAVENGADLVVELPVAWAMSSAQTFARGAVGILNALGCVDMISFGSESADVKSIEKCAAAMDDEKTVALVKEHVASGLSYPSAVEKAVSLVLGEEAALLFASPNDTLNIEYLRALKEKNSSIVPFAVRRTSKHDGGASAMEIRILMKDGADFSSLMPEKAAATAAQLIDDGFAPCDVKNVERAVLAKLRTMSVGEIAQAPDVTQGLENRIYDAVRKAASLDELYSLVKTKRYTHAKIRRVILSLFLGIAACDSQGIPPYVRVIAANSRGVEILSKAKKTAALPIVARCSDFDSLNEKSRRTFELECKAGDLFALCSPVARPCGLEMTQKFILV